MRLKSIFCISNVNVDLNTDDMTNFVKSLNVNPLSCFEVKNKFVDTKAFRMCINADDTEKFLDADSWPASIVVRDWIFKGTNTITKG